MRPAGREFDLLGLQEGEKHEVKSRKEGGELTVVEKAAWLFHGGAHHHSAGHKVGCRVGGCLRKFDPHVWSEIYQGYHHLLCSGQGDPALFLEKVRVHGEQTCARAVGEKGSALELRKAFGWRVFDLTPG